MSLILFDKLLSVGKTFYSYQSPNLVINLYNLYGSGLLITRDNGLDRIDFRLQSSRFQEKVEIAIPRIKKARIEAPIDGYLRQIERLCPTHAQWIYAIAIVESRGGSQVPNAHNWWGRKSKNGGWASWSSPEEAIQNQCLYLKKQYFDKGLTTTKTINKKYAESNDWWWKVEQFL